MMELSGIQGRETIMAIVFLMTHLAARFGGQSFGTAWERV